MALVVSVIVAAGSASAATLNVVGGQLLGASDVNVGGSSYNVEFLDGTCIALYSGCEDVSGFMFQTAAAAELASQALLDQVFLDGADLFDTDPELTVGCTSISNCFASTPYALPGEDVLTSAARNVAPASGTDSTIAVFYSVGVELGSGGIFEMRTYAVWSPVPEPGTAVLMGLGGLGLSFRKHRDR